VIGVFTGLESENQREVCVVGVGAGAETAAVCADTAVAEPPEFRAVTATRIVPPTSALVSWYVCPDTPEIAAQPAPAASQRRHS